MNKKSMDKIQWDRIYQLHVGGVLLVFGRSKGTGADDPVIFSAAMSERELRSEVKGGFGATEAEAAADLFRTIRDMPPFGGAVDVGLGWR